MELVQCYSNNCETGIFNSDLYPISIGTHTAKLHAKLLCLDTVNRYIVFRAYKASASEDEMAI